MTEQGGHFDTPEFDPGYRSIRFEPDGPTHDGIQDYKVIQEPKLSQGRTVMPQSQLCGAVIPFEFVKEGWGGQAACSRPAGHLTPHYAEIQSNEIQVSGRAEVVTCIKWMTSE